MKNSRGAIFARALSESIAQYGQIFQPDIGHVPVSAVDQERVRVRFYELYNDGGAKPDAKLKAYSRALLDAQKSRYVDNRTKDNVTMIWVCHGEPEEE